MALATIPKHNFSNKEKWRRWGIFYLPLHSFAYYGLSWLVYQILSPQNLWHSHHFWTKFKKQLFVDVLQNGCSHKFRKIHRKTPLLESLFNKVADRLAGNFNKNRLQRSCFLMNFAKFFRTTFSQNTSRELLLNLQRSKSFLQSISIWW